MATLNNVNIFAPKDPETGKTYELFDADAIKQKQRQQKEQRDKAAKILAEELKAKNVRKAYEEGFTQLPIGEQFLHYMNPVTGVPVEGYEFGYFTKEGGLGVKTPREMLVDAIDPRKNIFQKSFLKAEDPVSAAIAPLSALGALGGIGELANIPKAGLMALRRFQQKTMDGGGGGIGGLPAPKQETTKDLAGTYSKTLEEAKAASEEMSPTALLQYLKSKKRTEKPENNKLKVSLPKSEIDEINFSAFEEQYPNKDYTNEDILQYIDDNRIQLYRVSRSEDNPTYKAFDTDGGVDLYLDEPLTGQVRDERMQTYLVDYNDYAVTQKEFMQNNFPDGINKQNYEAFAQRQREFIQRRDVDTSGQAPSQLTNEYITNNDESYNPFAELGVSQYDVFKADGSQIDIEMNKIDENLEGLLDKGYTLKPRILDPNIADNIAENAAESRVDFEYDAGLGEEVYRYVGEDDLYEVIGNEQDGYSVRLNGQFDDANFGENLSLDEARIQIGQYEGTGIGKVDDPGSEDNLIDVLPDDVIEGNATIPTKYGYQYESFRLPMGGASNYQEHTVHVKNPKTSVRYTYRDGDKHFGGGDELFHYRTTIRTDENGKKVLFVEEIQSDLHSTARSTQDAADYETTTKQKQEISQNMQKIDPRIEFGQLNKDFPDSDDYVRFGFDEDAMLIPVSQVRRLAQDDGLDTYTKLKKEGNLVLDETTPGGLKQLDYILKHINPEQLKDVAKQLDSYTFGRLPNFPYKGNAWVDAVTKDAMKLGAELDVDRVAFTNAATQMDRNNKSLRYVQDRIIKKMPTKDELFETPEFAQTYAQNLKLRYEDYVNRSHDTSQPIPTQEEFYASIPKARKRIKDINKESLKIAQEMELKYLDDVRKFKQQYPDSSFVEQKFPRPLSGYEFEKAYKDLGDAEIQILSKRMNDAFDITSDPRNVDITNPALARMLDADLNFRKIPAEIDNKFTEIRRLNYEKNNLDELAYRDKEQLKEVTQAQLINDLELNRPFRVEDVGYRLEGDEILNPQRIQMEGDDYDTQRFNLRKLTNEDELLAEIPENFRGQVKKDLAAGKKEITLNIDDLEGSGKKFLEIYKNGIIRGINKSVKDLKIDAKPNVSRVLYAAEDSLIDTDAGAIYNAFLNATEGPNATFRSSSTISDQIFDTPNYQIGAHSSIGIDLTPEMKQKLLTDGYASMYMGGKVTKSKSMDRPIEGNRREM